MSPRVDIVSIGTLSSNPFWGEKGPMRASHATTTLIRDGSTTILVDPSLPSAILTARLDEAVGLKPHQIDIIFLTNFRPVHRRGVEAFGSATWLLGGVERDFFLEQMTRHVADRSDLSAQEADGPIVESRQSVQSRDVGPPPMSKKVRPVRALTEPDDTLGADARDVERLSPPANELELAAELRLLKHTQPAPDKLTPNVHLFPSFGVTPGACSLLVAGLRTVVVAGDAIITRDYYEHGRVFERSADFEKAKESFADIIEVADVIVPGHDNIILAR